MNCSKLSVTFTDISCPIFKYYFDNECMQLYTCTGVFIVNVIYYLQNVVWSRCGGGGGLSCCSGLHSLLEWYIRFKLYLSLLSLNIIFIIIVSRLSSTSVRISSVSDLSLCDYRWPVKMT